MFLTYNMIIFFFASHITKENNCICDTVKIFHSYPEEEQVMRKLTESH